MTLRQRCTALWSRALFRRIAVPLLIIACLFLIVTPVYITYTNQGNRASSFVEYGEELPTRVTVGLEVLQVDFIARRMVLLLSFIPYGALTYGDRELLIPLLGDFFFRSVVFAANRTMQVYV